MAEKLGEAALEIRTDNSIHGMGCECVSGRAALFSRGCSMRSLGGGTWSLSVATLHLEISAGKAE